MDTKDRYAYICVCTHAPKTVHGCLISIVYLIIMSTTTLQIFKNRLTMEPGKDLKNVMELMHALAAERPPYSERWNYHNKSSILHFGTLGQRNNRTILSIYRRNLRPAI